MRKKFKIMLTEDYWEAEKRGKPYLPAQNCFVVMNGGGVFFLVNNEPYYPSITKLSEVIGNYDVIWKE